jgi:cadmium resistance protein CadD (predicted permease)
MIDLFALIGVGVSAFVVTNIDDLFVLMVFFSNRNFGKIQVILGQYLGISLLVILSTLGALISFVIPQSLIGLLGLVPITIGIIRLVRPEKEENSLFETPDRKIGRWSHLSTLTVAAVTFSNGRDNIGIYTPLC